MKLPNPDLAVIDDRKLAGYSLNLDHDEGKHKARVFKGSIISSSSPRKRINDGWITIDPTNTRSIESKPIDSTKQMLHQRTNTHRSTYLKPNHPDLNQSVPNYDENDFWTDYDYF